MFRAPIYGASRGHLCDSSALLFNILKSRFFSKHFPALPGWLCGPWCDGLSRVGRPSRECCCLSINSTTTVSLTRRRKPRIKGGLLSPVFCSFSPYVYVLPTVIAVTHVQESHVREYVFYVFFRFEKHEFYVFLKGRLKKRKVTKKVSSLLNVYRNFGLKTPGCYGYL